MTDAVRIVFTLVMLPSSILIGFLTARLILGEVTPEYGGSGIFDFYRWAHGGVYGGLFGIVFTFLLLWKGKPSTVKSVLWVILFLDLTLLLIVSKI
jgi:hypothetical protein